LLDALPAGDVSDLEADLAIVTLKAHQSTHSVGGAIKYVDFPIDAVLSVVVTLRSGATVEVGTVGSESFVETDAALHSGFSSRTSFCQVQGRVGRMSLDRFEQRMDTSAAFASFMRHSVRATLFSSQQFTVCNVKHGALERCARWLAMTADRVGRSEFTLTSDFLAIMLGLKSAAVSDAVDALAMMGAIDYHRGAVTVVNAAILQRAACECYAVCKASFAAALRREC
jgi:CRP-like cAMP-binding protein